MIVRNGRWHLHPHVRSGTELSAGERAADIAVRAMGSWAFLIAQSVIVLAWILVNVSVFVFRWDPYPFILLNLAFSTQAAYAAPLILLAGRRQDSRNYELAQADYNADCETQRLVKLIAAKLEIA